MKRNDKAGDHQNHSTASHRHNPLSSKSCAMSSSTVAEPVTTQSLFLPSLGFLESWDLGALTVADEALGEAEVMSANESPALRTSPDIRALVSRVRLSASWTSVGRGVAEGMQLLGTWSLMPLLTCTGSWETASVASLMRIDSDTWIWHLLLCDECPCESSADSIQIVEGWYVWL